VRVTGEQAEQLAAGVPAGAHDRRARAHDV
jgi:hypothetical protein